MLVIDDANAGKGDMYGVGAFRFKKVCMPRRGEGTLLWRWCAGKGTATLRIAPTNAVVVLPRCANRCTTIQHAARRPAVATYPVAAS